MVTPVTDIARLHVAGLLLPDLKGKRLLAAPHPASWVDILDLFRKLYPNKKFFDNPENGPEAVRSYDDSVALDILKQVGRSGWVSLEETLKQTVAAVA